MLAQAVPERPVTVGPPAETEQSLTVTRPSMAAAVLLIKNQPQKYRIRLYDLLKGDVYCDIQNVTSEATGSTQIQFDYRGLTSANLAPISAGNAAGSGSYRINIPLLGITDVKVSLTFANDGTARGEWRNLGSGGVFDIVKK